VAAWDDTPGAPRRGGTPPTGVAAGAPTGVATPPPLAETLAPRAKVLCVDDEPLNLELLARSLRRRFDVLTAGSPEQGLDLLHDNADIAVVLSDYRMPGMTGAELLSVAARVCPDARRVLITGYADADNLIAAINSGPIHYVVVKPWKHQELHQLLDQLVHAVHLERENRQLNDALRTAHDGLEAKERLLERALDERGKDLSFANAELERMGRELEVLSFKDALTGLYNHRAFQERLREEVARATRYSQPMALLIADVDGFGAINQEIGYQLGDEVLRRIAAVLGAAEPGQVRASDILARYGGEEFAILLPETQKPGAITKALRLRDAVARVELPAGRAVSISVGVASFPDDAEGPEELIRAAESALRGAKGGGPGRVHFFSNGDGADQHQHLGAPASIAVTPPEPELDRFRPYHERMTEIIAILQRDRAISCLRVDLTRLRRIEIELGVAQHAELYERAGAALDALRGDELRRADLICRTTDDDAYVVILAPRDSSTQVDLDRLAAAVEQAVTKALAPLVRDLLRDQPRIAVGAARVLGNTMHRPERLIARLMHEADEAAALARRRAAHRDKAVLQDVILGDGLIPVYQPIVHVESGGIFGYEALTRGPRHSAMESPATLFAIADEVDLTFELDRACFRGALRGAVGLEPVHRLFVNLLPLSFYDAAFIEIEVSRLLEAAALTPANIVFEITERLAIENFTTFRRALATYTAMGFGVAIDDVGTRHSNLETVMALRPHFIKISDVLTRGVARSTVKREMLRSLGHIAEAIDAVIVAEGIESADDLLVLHDLGIRYGQGFFLARPGPPFPRLRASVRRAIRTLATSGRAPIAVPPADFDDDGEMRESGAHVDPGADIAAGSGQHTLPEPPAELVPGPAHGAIRPRPRTDSDEETHPGLAPRRPRGSVPPDTQGHGLGPGGHGLPDDNDDFGEVTQPRVIQPWRPLRFDDLQVAEETRPLIDSLRRPTRNDPEGAPPEPTGPESGGSLN
jgi:diguanylate cyclase (GGDEF)-like protein